MIALLAAALLAGLLGPSRASAHLRLNSAEPAEGEELLVAPEALRLAFSRPVELAFSRLALRGPAGEVPLGTLALVVGTDNVLVAPVRGPLVAGTYAVLWQTAGPDGHPIRGEYRFQILPAARGVAPPPAGPAGAPGPAPIVPAVEERSTEDSFVQRFDAGSPLYAAVRWLTFIGLLGAIGVVAFRLLVLGLVARREGALAGELIERSARGAAAVGLAAAGVLAAALLLRLHAQSVALHGAENAWMGERLAAMLSGTTWGWGWLLQAGGTAVALVGLAAARRGVAGGWTFAAPGVVGLAFTPALSGHAAGMERYTGLAVLADGLHVLGAGGWLGSLVAVVAVGIPVALRLGPERRGASVSALINAFSPTALAFAGLVVATGVLAAWLHLGSVSALWESAYGRTLLLKLVVLTGVFGTGAYNWRRVKPSLGTEAAAGRLRRSAALELAIGVVVLAITAVLVATPPPASEGMDMAARSAPLPRQHSAAPGE